ncbi:MAG TPA: copper-binding protein [Burkholderiales bacterium]|nr:copper-binding protein [Burkholderiales bacterium]
MKISMIVLAALAIGFGGAATAQNEGRSAQRQASESAAADALADGEVRKVDVEAKKITVRHGPLPSLDMPQPMTMVYQVRDPALLGAVKPGDKIRFIAEKAGGQYFVTRIEPAK